MRCDVRIFMLLVFTGCSGLELDIKVDLPVQSGGREYIYYTEKVSWNEAAMFCQSIGGELAKIDSGDFQQRLIDAFTTEYGSNPFPDDYWTGIIQPTQGYFTWATDCSEAYYTTHLNKDWDSSKHCFKFKKDDITADREPCSATNAFICEKPLASSCNMIEVFSTNSLGTESIDLTTCEAACNTDPDCWMVMFTPPYGCVKLAYNTATLVSGVQDANSPVKLNGKFCIEVTKVTNSITPPISDSSDNPIIDCSVPAIIPAAVSAVPVTSPAPTPCSTHMMTIVSTQVCTTQTVTTTSLPPCTTQTFTESIYHTLSCATETFTVIPTPSCSNEPVTVLPSPSCTDQTVTVTPLTVYQTVSQSACTSSSCFCSPTATSVILSSSCSSLLSVETTTSVVPANSSANALEIAEEISQNLTIDAKLTAAYQRKLSSARDNRTSSKIMGYLGICFVSIPLCLILLMDTRRLFTDFVGSFTKPKETDSLTELNPKRC